MKKRNMAQERDRITDRDHREEEIEAVRSILKDQEIVPSGVRESEDVGKECQKPGTQERETRERGMVWELGWERGHGWAPPTSFSTPPPKRDASHKVLWAALMAGQFHVSEGHSLGFPPGLSFLVSALDFLGTPNWPSISLNTSSFSSAWMAGGPGCQHGCIRGCGLSLFAWASLPSSLSVSFPLSLSQDCRTGDEIPGSSPTQVPWASLDFPAGVGSPSPEEGPSTPTPHAKCSQQGQESATERESAAWPGEQLRECQGPSSLYLSGERACPF